MVKKLKSKFEFSKMCRVSAAAITKACKGSLKPALSDKRIDAAHPAAVAYYKKQTKPPTLPRTVTDPLPDPEFITVSTWCMDNKIYSVRGIVRGGLVSRVRAERILKVMRESGLVPDGKASISPGAKAPTPPKAEPLPRLSSGQTAVRDAKQNAAPAPGLEGPIEIPENITDFLDYTLRDLIRQFGTSTALKDWLDATHKIENINEKRLKNAKAQGELVSRELVTVGIIDPIEAAHLSLLTGGKDTIALRADAMSKAGRPIEDIQALVEDQISSLIKPVKVKVRRALESVRDK